MASTLTALSEASVLLHGEPSVVATRRCPSYSSMENWLSRCPSTLPEAR